MDKFSARQLECMMCLANGNTILEASKILFISKSSVNQSLDSARKKARAKNNIHLVSIAIAQGFLVWEDDEEKTRSMKNEKEPPQSDSPFRKPPIEDCYDLT
jgi:DNA-binding CsgD family transcriptional regulator